MRTSLRHFFANTLLVNTLLANTLLANLLLASAALAQTPCHVENDGPNFADGVSIGSGMVGIRFTAAANIVISRIEVFTGEATSVHALALWTHNGGTNKPQAPMSSGSFQVSPTNGWQGAQLNAPCPLFAGTTYWMVWTVTAGSQPSLDVPMPSLGQVFRTSFDGGQTWSGPFQVNDRHWKFRLYGACSVAPIVYCTAGVTTHGCAASISASDNPNVSHAQACQVTVTNVEGEKSGILFYGLGSATGPWCSGNMSFLCVKAPTSRTGVQTSGGTAGACDGSLSLDWNAFQLATPGALGQPWSVGSAAYVQAWFRDPPACKTTGLSDALELTYQP